MIPGIDGYFDSESIEEQVERLCQMLEFKTEYNFPVKHTFELVFDNARTHTKAIVNIDDFRFHKFSFLT